MHFDVHYFTGIHREPAHPHADKPVRAFTGDS